MDNFFLMGTEHCSANILNDSENNLRGFLRCIVRQSAVTWLALKHYLSSANPLTCWMKAEPLHFGKLFDISNLQRRLP
jgi:hypothetical protein